MRQRRTQPTESLQRGQSLVEFAIGLVIIILLLSGLLDLGRLYFTYVALEDGAGEAVLYLALFPDCPRQNGRPECNDPNNAEYRAKHAGGGDVNWTDATILIDIPEDASGNTIHDVGEPVSVTVNYPFQLLTPIIPKIVGLNPITLSVQASQVIIGE